MSKPIRIQRSRQHKQVSPNGLPIKYVGRGSKYGNFLKLDNGVILIDTLHTSCGKPNRYGFLHKRWAYLCKGDLNLLLSLYNGILTDNFYFPARIYDEIMERIEDIEYWTSWCRKLDLTELKNKNLSCWCKEERCHATILLKIANDPQLCVCCALGSAVGK